MAVATKLNLAACCVVDEERRTETWEEALAVRARGPEPSCRVTLAKTVSPAAREVAVTRTPASKVSPTLANLGSEAVSDSVRRTTTSASAAPNKARLPSTANARRTKVPRLLGAVNSTEPSPEVEVEATVKRGVVRKVDCSLGVAAGEES